MPTPGNDPAGPAGDAWERQPRENRGVWLWVIYRADIHVLGAIRRATRLHWNADGAKEEVCGVVNRLWSSREAETEAPNWDRADEATWVWRSKDYLITDYPQPSKLSTNHEQSTVSAGLNDGTEQSPVSKRPQ